MPTTRVWSLTRRGSSLVISSADQLCCPWNKKIHNCIGIRSWGTTMSRYQPIRVYSTVAVVILNRMAQTSKLPVYVLHHHILTPASFTHQTCPWQTPAPTLATDRLLPLVQQPDHFQSPNPGTKQHGQHYCVIHENSVMHAFDVLLCV